MLPKRIMGRENPLENVSRIQPAGEIPKALKIVSPQMQM